ncbi:MAG TPA: 50S ribosomal protein L11 methyltransferase [Thiotrichaceae bacterium]|nr:50S ribosomal protein L11 methyltransferase [Thiotrichaceae bacterium]
MSWKQLFCTCSRELESVVTDLLEVAGAASVCYQDAKDNPILEPPINTTPLWDSIVFTGLYDESIDLQATIDALGLLTPQVQNIYQEPLVEQVWERAWMDNFKPMCFGSSLWIYPSHITPPRDDNTYITLDPGLAFGTGTHPTTALCLEWLDKNPPVQKTVLDYGCGSGILAIAALKLGATLAISTDIDPQALTATTANANLNSINLDKIPLYFPDELPGQAVDVLLANILSGPLVELAPKLATKVVSKGQLVLSGILAAQESAIIKAYTPYFKNISVRDLDGWLRITASRL